MGGFSVLPISVADGLEYSSVGCLVWLEGVGICQQPI